MRKGIVLTGIVCILFMAVIGCWSYHCLFPSKKQANKAKVTVMAYSRYEITQDGKLVFCFDEDTIRMAANFTDKWALIPSCQGRMAVAYNKELLYDNFKGTNPDTIFAQKVDSIDSVYTDSRWKVGELNYYIHSHSVQDFGYNRICDYAEREVAMRDAAKKMLDSLKHINKEKGHFKIKKSITYRAFYRNANGKLVSEPCRLLEKMEGANRDGSYLFQLVSKSTPEGVSALTPSLSVSLSTTQANTILRKIDYTHLPDSLGYYEGTYDSIYQANGYGRWQGYDGIYYEGVWLAGKRNGWGFSIAPKKPLRVGEWKADRYKGERLVYTSERIYGIDISKYQHGKGRKKYAIDWSRLRITHLGNISRKTISGAVNFPIRYIYIKSTEGASLVNPYYKADYRAARAHGYKVGTYHFFSTISPAVQQANHFLKHSRIQRGDFPPVLDVEPLPCQIKKMGGSGVLFARVRTWLRLVERATGTKPILYISQMFVNRYLPMAPDLKHNYQIWIARYGEYKPDIHLIYWQLCPDGRVAGIKGEVDINVFNGYKDTFSKFAQNYGVK